MDNTIYYSLADAKMVQLFEKYKKLALVIEGQVMFMDEIKLVQVPQKAGWFFRKTGLMLTKVEEIIFLTHDIDGNIKYKVAGRSYLLADFNDDKFLSQARQKWLGHMKFMEFLGFSIVKNEHT